MRPRFLSPVRHSSHHELEAVGAVAATPRRAWARRHEVKPRRRVGAVLRALLFAMVAGVAAGLIATLAIEGMP